MHRCALALVSAAAVALASVSIPAQGAEAEASVSTPSAEQTTLARGLIVKAKSNSQTRRTSLARTAEASLPDEVSVSSTSAGFSGLSLVSIDQSLPADELDASVAALEARSDVEWVVPNALRQAFSAAPVETNDPYFDQLTHLWDTRATGGWDTASLPDGGYSSKALSLWPATKGKSSVVVAVVDTGLVANHPDLVGRTVPGYDFVDDECSEWDGDDNCTGHGHTYVSAGDGSGWDNNPTDPGDWLDEATAARCGYSDPADEVADSSWHGTHVAGIIAASANNGIGVAGVAPGVKVQPVRVLGHCGGTDWDIAMGVLWASGENVNAYDTDHGTVPRNATPAKIINLSLGGLVAPWDRQDYCDFYGAVSSIARSNGATLVAAAGNNSDTRILDVSWSVPASCPGYLAVAATSDTGHRAWYSQAGSGIDLSAPGGDVNVEGTGHGIVSTLDSGATVAAGPTYAEYQGTSMATPVVAGGAALLYSLGITNPAALEAALTASVQPFPAASSAYNARTITFGGGGGLTTADLNCTTSLCGTGILDLSTVPAPVSGPSIRGVAAVGKTLTATPGTWVNLPGGPTLTWYRDGLKRRTGATYPLTASDGGRHLTVRATSPKAVYSAITASADVAVAKAPTKTVMRFPSKVKKTKKYTVSVKVTTVAGVTPSGHVKVYDGKKRIAATVMSSGSNGKLKIRLPKLKKGKHKLKVVYYGSTSVAKSTSAVKTVRSK